MGFDWIFALGWFVFITISKDVDVLACDVEDLSSVQHEAPCAWRRMELEKSHLSHLVLGHYKKSCPGVGEGQSGSAILHSEMSYFLGAILA